MGWGIKVWQASLPLFTPLLAINSSFFPPLTILCLKMRPPVRQASGRSERPVVPISGGFVWLIGVTRPLLSLIHTGNVQNSGPGAPSNTGQGSTTNNNGENGQNNTTSNATAPFSHPGARMMAEGSASGDGPYWCKKCGLAVLTISCLQCPACLDNHPWLPP
ncbi:hypothetical protein EI94DRAFT_1736996, partial [Lactarius quietus]